MFLSSDQQISTLYMTYMPASVKRITIFAREIPQFCCLDTEDQRALIKGALLEVGPIQHMCYLDLEESVLRDTKLMFVMKTDETESRDPVVRMLQDYIPIYRSIKKMNLTDVELSLFHALLLLCSGKDTDILGPISWNCFFFLFTCKLQIILCFIYMLSNVVFVKIFVIRQTE